VIDLDQIGRSLRETFHDLGGIEPLRVLGSGFSSVAVETAGGIVFRIAQVAAAGARYMKEWQHLGVLKSYLPVAIPQPKWYHAGSSNFPNGVIGYKKLPGVPLEPDNLRTLAEAKQVAEQIAEIILALHRVPPSMVPVRDDFDARRREWLAQRDIVLPALRTALEPNEYRAVADWWDEFLVDDIMRDYQPVLQHGDLWFGNMLVEESQSTQIIGLVDFENLAVGDPTLDFVPQLYLGQDFFDLVVTAYQVAGGVVDVNFDHRLHSLWTVREFSGLQFTFEQNDAEEFADSIAKIRKGPILNPAGLDGWHREWEKK
jgi:aminoglycoside phosphotransferase (APT) family kinase protein